MPVPRRFATVIHRPSVDTIDRIQIAKEFDTSLQKDRASTFILDVAFSCALWIRSRRAQDLFSIDVRDNKQIMSQAFLYDDPTDPQEKVSVIENV